MNLNDVLSKNYDELEEYDIVCCVDALIQRLKLELGSKIRNGIYGSTQRSMAYNSSRIEGNTLTEEQTASLFETGTVFSDGRVVYVSKDIEEMNGHFCAFNYMLKTYDEELSQEIIKNMHYELKIGVFEDRANGFVVGDYKKTRNVVGNVKTAEPDKVEEEMNNLINWYNALNKPVTVNELLEFHVKYETIHPFQDGNGRTGRIILFRECLKNYIIPIVIKEFKKPEYIKGLISLRDNKDITIFKHLAEESMREYYESIQYFLYKFDNQTCVKCGNKLLSTGECVNCTMK